MFYCRLTDASAYIKFVCKSIYSHDLFQSLMLKPKSCWKLLLWMDKVCMRVCVCVLFYHMIVRFFSVCIIYHVALCVCVLTYVHAVCVCVDYCHYSYRPIMVVLVYPYPNHYT